MKIQVSLVFIIRFCMSVYCMGYPIPVLIISNMPASVSNSSSINAFFKHVCQANSGAEKNGLDLFHRSQDSYF